MQNCFFILAKREKGKLKIQNEKLYDFRLIQMIVYIDV